MRGSATIFAAATLLAVGSTLALIAPAATAGDQTAYTREVKRAAAAHLAALGLLLRREAPYVTHAVDHSAALLAAAAAGRELYPPDAQLLDVPGALDERIVFDDMLDAWLEAARQLHEAAQRDSLPALAEPYRDLAASCKACHDRFRVLLR